MFLLLCARGVLFTLLKGTIDGLGTVAQLVSPSGVSIDPTHSEYIYVADLGGGAIRLYNFTSLKVTTAYRFGSGYSLLDVLVVP